MFRKSKYGTGYLEDPYSTKDYTIEDTTKHSHLFTVQESKIIMSTTDNYPTKGGMSESVFTPIRDQSRIGSCTAHAGVAIMEYWIKQRTKKNLNLSELYLYYVTRFLLGWENKDSGAYLRKTMEALSRFGVPEEKFWRYDTSKWKVKPDNLVTELANDYRAVRYMRLDQRRKHTDQILKDIKSMLLRKLPIMFGFSCYKDSLSGARRTGEIAFPHSTDKQTGGHAIVIIGYDDDKKISDRKGKITTGALRIRNSWGKNWGDKGYGWLPYQYVLSRKARDYWVMRKADWVKTSNFE